MLKHNSARDKPGSPQADAMPTYKLTYFAVRGVAEVVRYSIHIIYVLYCIIVTTTTIIIIIIIIQYIHIIHMSITHVHT